MEAYRRDGPLRAGPAMKNLNRPPAGERPSAAGRAAGRAVREARERLGWSPAGLAWMARVPVESVLRLEEGRPEPAGRLRAVRAALAAGGAEPAAPGEGGGHE